MKKILITGGLGHIGSRICNFFLEKNYDVFCIDNFMTHRYISLKGLINKNNFKFSEVDVVKDKDELESIINKNNFDAIIHLAAITDAASSFDKKDKLLENNLNSTKNIVDICLKKNLRLIYPSSTSVYGSSEKIVDEENNDFLNPQSPYAECKLLEEEIILNSLKNNFYILRLGTIFGVSNGMRFHTAVNKFCFQVVTGVPITVWETAMDQFRPYLDLEDACRCSEFFIKNEKKFGIYNVNTLNLTVRELINEIKNHTKLLEIKYVNSKIMNQLSYFVSNKKIINCGFVFNGSLKKSISDTFNWFN